ncbi:hypothetical protein BGZ94_006281 [Podila epigama]|nr:hypothetical protein BGZ94_006281 [Podila epigama]
MGKRQSYGKMYTEDLKLLRCIDIDLAKKLTGSYQYVVSRPDLYDLLLRQIPADCIMLGRRVLTTMQNDNGVMIRCSDNSVHHGDILVGADGAYSAVRQQMYKNLKSDGHLPACDDVELPFSCVCLVGQTLPLDPEEFPVLKQDDSECVSVLGRENYCTWFAFATKQNTVCWMVVQFLNKDTKKDNDAFRNSEWGWEAADAMAQEVKDFKLPGLRNGQPMTLGDYINKTPSEQMSKVMLEEIVFETWYQGRTVLIGDVNSSANFFSQTTNNQWCSHYQMNPSGGVGAAHAIHDAVALANWISTLRKPTMKELETVFEEYRTERHPVVKEAFAICQMARRNFGKNMSSVMTRSLLQRIPSWLYRMIVKKTFVARNQVSFLPLVEDTGSSKPCNQPSLQKTLKILKEQEGLTGDEIIARKVPEIDTKTRAKASFKRAPEVVSTTTSASASATATATAAAPASGPPVTL